MTPWNRLLLYASLGALVAFLAVPRDASGQLQFEAEPIRYEHATPRDRVARLAERIVRGEVQLDYDSRHGYLPALLEALDIPISSQGLVFSQTSFQLRKISPHRPRAVYFNDDSYVGWVQGGDVIELTAIDPQLGAVFYTLDQERAESPRFIRDRGQCLSCHAGSRTQGVPGLLVRSVFPDSEGRPVLGSGTFTTDHRSPFHERWGGWYVTGTHGALRHMGNAILRNRQSEELDREQGANVTELSDHFNTRAYLSPHSDLVALMVLEHETQMHNALTLANFETRLALHYDQAINTTLGRPADQMSDSTRRRIATVGDQVVRHLFLAGEFRLTSEVKGTSRFATEFQQAGPRDSRGRSLRELDLRERLFKYPCSFLVHSPSFDALPPEVKSHVLARMRAILDGEDTSGEFRHLTLADRVAIREILRDTLKVAWDSHSEPLR